MPAEAFREYPLLLCWVCKREIVKWLRKEKYKKQVASPVVKVAVGRLCPRCNTNMLRRGKQICDNCRRKAESIRNRQKYLARRTTAPNSTDLVEPYLDPTSAITGREKFLGEKPSEPSEGSGGTRDMGFGFSP